MAATLRLLIVICSTALYKNSTEAMDGESSDLLRIYYNFLRYNFCLHEENSGKVIKSNFFQSFS